MARSGTCAVRVKPLGMGKRHETQVIGEFAVLLRPQKEVPVIRHDAPRKNAHGHTLLHLAQHLLECEVVAVTVENRAFTVGSV
jgi:hypothetical protein